MDKVELVIKEIYSLFSDNKEKKMLRKINKCINPYAELFFIKGDLFKDPSRNSGIKKNIIEQFFIMRKR